MAEKLRIIWLSANIFGYWLLQEAMGIKDLDVCAIFTLSPKSTTKMYDGIESKEWLNFGIPVERVENINDKIELIKSYHPDLIIMAGWRQIIKKELLAVPLMGIVGLHPTLLPEGRGSAPIIKTILTGLKISGVTIYYLGEGLDDGDIIGQEVFLIKSDDHAQDVYEKVIVAGRKLIRQYLPMLIKLTAPRTKQYTIPDLRPKIILNAELDFENESIDALYKKIRAFSKPYLGAYVVKDGKKLVIWRAELQERKI